MKAKACSLLGQRALNSYLIHVHLLECSLQQLEVVNVLVLQISLEFHPLQHEGT